MEKKDYYTLKEVILGLNHAYQLHQKELDELKELCEIDERRAIDFRFKVFQPGFLSIRKNPVLLCTYEPKRNRIQKLVACFNQKMGIDMDTPAAHLVTDYNRYYFYGAPNYPVHVKYHYGMEQMFYEHVNDILSSDFSNYMNSGYIDGNFGDSSSNLYINTNYIQLLITGGSNQFLESKMYYDPIYNILEFSRNRGYLSNQYLEDILNLKFVYGDLNPYHIKTIQASSMTEKPIVLGYVSSVQDMKFEILEEENQVVLSKRG